MQLGLFPALRLVRFDDSPLSIDEESISEDKQRNGDNGNSNGCCKSAAR
jgi:hypothetical protein